ncbi:MAG: protein-glutamate O-methyltransferase CheR [Candidatus Pristimantibacillus lignocellulolyticus]|uniref:protein-glutamate O-methyltransferase n=1 Tax=Candidatus Pristimantibacillus lignocellulolyticus TaxID=2994561 RepID=A0A9J6ZDH6_9BACL|nr:MAG: protein-glutamate O-methyltransferase CheR [Candidatus Pristimantibacillus lignocellulolyticus]
MSEDLDFSRFIDQIKKKTDIDLSLYKEAQMKRRLTTLRMKHGFQTFDSYFQQLSQNKVLLDEFLDRMTINVSEFWRNPQRWETLRTKFLPEMIQTNNRVKIWSAACSTGEEPYTLAMILNELHALQKTHLLATDLDAGVLAKATQGFYLDRSIRDVPQLFRQKYFQEEEGVFSVVDSLKKAVQFKQQNLLFDTFDKDFDLIVCRNVMIYFTEEAKNELYHKFAKALKPGGLLFVGSTEQIFTPSQYGFETVDTFFYRKL